MHLFIGLFRVFVDTLGDQPKRFLGLLLDVTHMMHSSKQEPGMCENGGDGLDIKTAWGGVWHNMLEPNWAGLVELAWLG